MKKTIALSFMLIANIILLAHAVVPHHEHENMLICFFDSHNEECSSTHTDTECNHHQDNTCSDRCCLIDNIFDPSDNKEKIICQTHTKCDCWKIIYLLTSSVLDLKQTINDSGFLFFYKPFIVFYYIDYASQSHGLRAPPCC